VAARVSDRPVMRATPAPAASATRLIALLSRQHGVPEPAVQALADAVHRGGGHMAQFDIPALGGRGQWMSGGLTMVGDLFNAELKHKVNRICQALAEAGAHDPYHPDHEIAWWPATYSHPAAVGGQNRLRYAYFPQDHALVVDNLGEVVVYDTTGQDLRGFSQAQPGDAGLSLHGLLGGVTLDRLPRKRLPDPE